MAVLTAEDRNRAKEMLRVLSAHPRITTEDGTVLDLPDPVVEALAEILEAAADGERALVLRSPENLTTEQAAAVLGVSRPTVVRLVESGKLPARMVGTHRRLSLSDVLTYREESAKRRSEALDQMAREAEEIGLMASRSTPEDLRNWVENWRATAVRERQGERLRAMSSGAVRMALDLIAIASWLHGWPIAEDTVRRREDDLGWRRWSRLRQALGSP